LFESKISIQFPNSTKSITNFSNLHYQDWLSFCVHCIHLCIISSPSFENPPVLISLLDPTDYWFDFGALEAALEAAADARLGSEAGA
jgi:hypothetical protein